jgi:hypothetical protein
MICARCGKPIQPGEPYETVIPDSMSGARPTVYYHQTPRQPKPAPIPH